MAESNQDRFNQAMWDALRQSWLRNGKPVPCPWPHFSGAEMRCQCGCGRMEMNPKFMDMLEMLRVAYGKPMRITSGFRCPEHNLQASTTGLSGPHTTGWAVDVQVSVDNVYHLVALAFSFGFTGIGVFQKGSHNSRFVHLDAIDPGPGRPRPRIWSY